MFTRASKNEKQVSSLPMRRGKKQQLFEQRRLQRNKLTLAGIDYNSIKKNIVKTGRNPYNRLIFFK